MFYKKKYFKLLDENKELKERLRQNDAITIDRHWQMLCQITELGGEVDKLKSELEKYKKKEEKNDNRTSKKGTSIL